MASFNPGDVLIDKIQIVSPRTSSWNLAPNFLSCDIFESIFTPAVLAYIEVLDDRDYLGTYAKLAGDELLNFSFRVPNKQTVNYSFHLNSVKDISVEGANKSKVYKLECISRESLTGQVNQVQKAYDGTIDEIVDDVVKTKLNTKLPLFTEKTKGKSKRVIVNQPALQVIETHRKEAVSDKNKGSNFMFWQTWRGFYFQSLEYMLQQGDVKTFKHINTVGHDIRTSIDDNILAYEVKQNMDAASRIHAGVMNHRVTTYDPHTHAYVSQDFTPKGDELTNLGKGIITTLSTFLNLFTGPSFNKTHFRVNNPNKSVGLGKSFVAESIPYKQLNMAQMQEQIMHMTVIGDPMLEPGKTVNNLINKITGETISNQADTQASGRWLIAKTHHQIRRPNQLPRYVMSLECLKGSFEEKV
jgi:hypothetical protein